MPAMVSGAGESGDIGALIGNRDFKYDYPYELDLRPGSAKHQNLLSHVMRYARESARIISRRHAAWHDIDDKLTAYVRVTDEERRVKTKNTNKPISIVFPYSYAILETLVSYMIAAFLPEPIFRYEGTGPEDVVGATLLEKIITLHCNHNRVGLNLHTMFRDAGAYGIGVVTPQWAVKTGRRTRRRPSASGTFERYAENVVLFEGNALSNIDPYRYLPDPNVPIHDVQRGEYVGWLDTSNYVDLLSQEQQEDGLFNVQYLQSIRNRPSTIFGGSYSQGTRNPRNDSRALTQGDVGAPIDLLYLYIKLIPEAWGVGSSTRPEKWLFTIANDSVLLGAQNIDLDHNMFPVAICAPDFDGYSPIAYSRLEQLQGMQVIIDWLFNSHVANVRKSLNDVLIVDPFLINMKDLEDPGPGGFVRLRQPAWGKNSLDQAVKQLAVTDITASNMRDVALVVQYMQQIGGTDNTLMGSLRRGGPERLTTAEYRGTARGQISRLERIAKVIGLQALQDIGYMFAAHAQQFMSEDVYIKASGSWDAELSRVMGVEQGRVRVSPIDLLVDYDVIPRDGSIPGGNYSNTWPKLFEVISSNPELMQQIDIMRVFEYIAESEGAKNVDRFRRQQPQQLQVAPDQAVQQQVQQGNLVPIGGANGSQGGASF